MQQLRFADGQPPNCYSADVLFYERQSGQEYQILVFFVPKEDVHSQLGVLLQLPYTHK